MNCMFALLIMHGEDLNLCHYTRVCIIQPHMKTSWGQIIHEKTHTNELKSSSAATACCLPYPHPQHTHTHQQMCCVCFECALRFIYQPKKRKETCLLVVNESVCIHAAAAAVSSQWKNNREYTLEKREDDVMSDRISAGVQ